MYRKMENHLQEEKMQKGKMDREGSQVRGPALSWVLLGDLPQHLG